MPDNQKIEELEKRVNQLQREAHELKIIINQLKRDSIQEHSLEEKPFIKERKKIELPRKRKDIFEEKEPIDWEKQIGQVWLPRIFIFVLLLGVIWAFKAASDYGFLNAPVKITIGYMAAATLLFLGQHQIKKNRDALGQVFLSGSVVLLIIDTFAMHFLYEMIPMVPALILNILWIGLGIYLSHRYHSEPLAILTAIGGYLIPFLLENENPNIINFVLFETGFYLTLLIFAMRKTFNFLYHTAFVLLHITLLAGVILIHPIDVKVFGIAVLIQHVLLLVTFFKKHSFFSQQMGVLFSSFLLTALWTKATFPANQFEWVILLVFVVYSLLSIYFWKRDQVRLSATLSISTLALLIFFVNRYDIENVAGLLMIQGLLSIYLGILASAKIKQITGAFIYFLSALITITILFEKILSIEFVNWLILLGSMLALLKLLSITEIFNEEGIDKTKQVIYVITMVLLLAFITLTVQALTDDFSLNIQYMSVSFSWGIYAFIGIIVGSLRDHKPLRIFGVALLFVTLAKLVFVDLAYISIIIRAILFIGLGLIGVVGSRVFYRKESNENK